MAISANEAVLNAVEINEKLKALNYVGDLKKILKALNIKVALGYNEIQMVDFIWNKIEEARKTENWKKDVFDATEKMRTEEENINRQANPDPSHQSSQENMVTPDKLNGNTDNKLGAASEPNKIMRPPVENETEQFLAGIDLDL